MTRFWISDLIIGAEYQHIDLGNVFHISSDGNPNDNRNYRATVDILRARVVFKLHTARNARRPLAGTQRVISKFFLKKVGCCPISETPSNVVAAILIAPPG